MTAHPKTPCEICGRLVTTIPQFRDAHMVSCKAKAAKVEEALTGEISKDPKIQRDFDRAMKARAQRRKTAPDMIVNAAPHTDALTQIENHLKRVGVIPEKMHCFWGDKKKHNQYIGNGYIPAIENGELTDHDENRLYFIDEAIHYAEELGPIMESRNRIDALNRKGEATIAADGENLPEDSMKIARDVAVQKATEARERREAELMAQM